MFSCVGCGGYACPVSGSAPYGASVSDSSSVAVGAIVGEGVRDERASGRVVAVDNLNRDGLLASLMGEVRDEFAQEGGHDGAIIPGHLPGTHHRGLPL